MPLHTGVCFSASNYKWNTVITCTRRAPAYYPALPSVLATVRLYQPPSFLLILRLLLLLLLLMLPRQPLVVITARNKPLDGRPCCLTPGNDDLRRNKQGSRRGWLEALVKDTQLLHPLPMLLQLNSHCTDCVATNSTANTEFCSSNFVMN